MVPFNLILLPYGTGTYYGYLWLDPYKNAELQKNKNLELDPCPIVKHTGTYRNFPTKNENKIFG